MTKVPVNRTFIVAIILAAAALRVVGLASRPVGHVEMYTPNIPLPAGLSEPPPRLTFVKTITGSLWEPHPPAWYAAAYPWTKVFGTSPVAMRAPSVAFGVLSVWLVYLFGRRTRGETTGLIAAALLAAHGLHIMWSQFSRPVLMVSMLGLLSSLALLRLIDGERGWRALPLYVAASLLGLATDYYFWLLFATHMLWVLLVSATARRHAAVLTWQFLVLILASPLISLAAFQRKDSYLRTDLFESLARYTGFGYLFTQDTSTVVVSEWHLAAVTCVGAVLLVVGLRRWTWSPHETTGDMVRKPGRRLVLAVAVIGVVLSAGAATAFTLVKPSVRPVVTLTALAPLLFVAVMPVATRAIDVVAARLRRAPDPAIVFGLGPAAIAAGISLFVPFVDPKYFLVFAPFLLILLAGGLEALLRMLGGWRAVLAGAAIIAVLVPAHVAAYRQQWGSEDSPAYFRELAAQWRPHLRESDFVLAYIHWAMTPTFYYLPRDVRYIGAEDLLRARQAASPRIWRLSVRDTGVPDPPRLEAAVRGCRLTETFVAQRIRVELFEDCPRIDASHEVR